MLAGRGAWGSASCLLLILLSADFSRTEAPPIEISQFQDSINHWQNKHGRDRKDQRWKPSQVVEIADNILQYQNPDGGWPKSIDWLAKIPAEEVREIYRSSIHRSTLDNRNTYPQVEYIAKVYSQTGIERFRESAARGLEYILAEQRPSGGWRGSDVDAITFNDDVMVGVMTLLLDIREGVEHFSWLDETRRKRVAEALDRAVSVTLACQIEVDGTKTAWCQQHDHQNLKPVAARTFELPSICGQESVGIVRFLMKLKDPSPEARGAVEAAVQWFEQAAIRGLRLERVPIPAQRFENHTATHDVVVVSDPAAPRMWARYYDLETGKPFFCNRDGRKVESLAEVEIERRTGYAWYGYWPESLLRDDYPSWRERSGGFPRTEEGPSGGLR
ncbi:MAG: pectate lyase [Candidatus Omnitrophica bacterium]|nr:hypothetical protein [bacterium]NUN95979.1 pectate lyase [Candidatus Omnitrophota bacterium]